MANVKKDGRAKTHYESGAVRDNKDGKGRCDLMPLDILGAVFTDCVFAKLDAFKRTGNAEALRDILVAFANEQYSKTPRQGVSNSPNGYLAELYLEVAKQFEDGAKHYGENNWQKGIPVNSYIDSAVRHYLKHIAGWADERHDRAFAWNITCCMWTMLNKPDLDNYTDVGKAVSANDK